MTTNHDEIIRLKGELARSRGNIAQANIQILEKETEIIRLKQERKDLLDQLNKEEK